MMDTKAAILQQYEREMEAQLEYERLVRANTRVCPACETEQFIPYYDYICKECRSEGP